MTPFPTLSLGWVTVAGLLFLSWPDVALALRRPFLWAFIGLAFVSALWSKEPRTLEASLVFTGDCWLGLVLARRYRTSQIVWLAWSAVTGVLLAHTAVIFLDPSTGFSEGGQWRGFQPHENALGRTAGLGLLLTAMLPAGSMKAWIRVGLGLLFAVLLLESTALTPFLALGICLAGYLMVRFCTTHRRALATLICVGGLLILYWEPILDAVDRSPVLSGRVKIWDASLRYVCGRIWFGHGYGACEPAPFVGLVHSHNGILNLMTQLGLVGSFLFLLDFATVVIEGGRRSGWNPARVLVPATYLLFLACLNLVEVAPPHAGHFAEVILYVAFTQQLLMGEPS